jgi:hypothetical protein
MYNLIIVGNEDMLGDGVIVMPEDRFTEHTAEEFKERYKDFDETAKKDLCSIPALFCAEGQIVPNRFGYIRNLSRRSGNIRIEFDVESSPKIKENISPKLFRVLDIDRLEFSRTHWAIKDIDLVEILTRYGFMDDNKIARPPLPKQKGKSVFIVHGRDNDTRGQVIDALKELGLNTVVLDEQANKGRSILDKIKAHSAVDYAVVIYTPCDRGRRGRVRSLKVRARQNVIFEHGLFVGKLGSENVMLLVKPHDEWELPSDVQGIGYTPIDKEGRWREKLKNEFNAAGCIS